MTLHYMRKGYTFDKALEKVLLKEKFSTESLNELLRVIPLVYNKEEEIARIYPEVVANEIKNNLISLIKTLSDKLVILVSIVTFTPFILCLITLFYRISFLDVIAFNLSFNIALTFLWHFLILGKAQFKNYEILFTLKNFIFSLGVSFIFSFIMNSLPVGIVPKFCVFASLLLLVSYLIREKEELSLHEPFNYLILVKALRNLISHRNIDSCIKQLAQENSNFSNLLIKLRKGYQVTKCIKNSSLIHSLWLSLGSISSNLGIKVLESYIMTSKLEREIFNELKGEYKTFYYRFKTLFLLVTLALTLLYCINVGVLYRYSSFIKRFNLFVLYSSLTFSSCRYVFSKLFNEKYASKVALLYISSFSIIVLVLQSFLLTLLHTFLK